MSMHSIQGKQALDSRSFPSQSVSSQISTLPTMKVLSTGTALALLANQAAAHYIWTSLTIGGTTGTGAAGGIRPNTNYNSPVIGMFAVFVY